MWWEEAGDGKPTSFERMVDQSKSTARRAVLDRHIREGHGTNAPACSHKSGYGVSALTEDRTIDTKSSGRDRLCQHPRASFCAREPRDRADGAYPAGYERSTGR